MNFNATGKSDPGFALTQMSSCAVARSPVATTTCSGERRSLAPRHTFTSSLEAWARAWYTPRGSDLQQTEGGAKGEGNKLQEG